jgi:hypothetical protein
VTTQRGKEEDEEKRDVLNEQICVIEAECDSEIQKSLMTLISRCSLTNNE